MALPKDRFERMSEIMEDVVSAYERQGRSVEEIVLGFDGGNVVLLALKDYRLLILHRDPEDTDEVCVIGHNFLDDLDRIEHGKSAKPGKKQVLSRSEVSLSLPETWRNRALTDDRLTVHPAEPLPQNLVIPRAEEEENLSSSFLHSPTPPTPPEPEELEPPENLPTSNLAQESPPAPSPLPQEAENYPAPALHQEANDGLSWEAYRKSLTRVLGKVMSRQTVSLFLNHELKTKRAIYGDLPSPDQFREIGDALTARIPDRVKRERIRTELFDLIQTTNL
tara:strand:- start:11397 stop:12233 length:837 start_codon:yes stop_codon:yes gene_type:complete